MSTNPFTHFVFVDLENVPGVDVSAGAGHPVHVTLLIGKHQKSFGLEMLHAAKSMGERLELIEVGASGHNALDITLAYYLGRAVEKAPKAEFAIVSKDKDFDPMIAHLQAKGISVARHTSFASLPFLTPAKKSSTKSHFATPPTVVSHKAPKLPAPPKPKVAVDKLPKFIAHLRNSPPSNRTKLEHMIAAYFKPSLPAGGMKGVIAELQKRNAIAIDASGKVTCPQ
jgi:hypothetical protein